MAKKYTELSKEEEQRAIDVHEKTTVINGLSLFRKGGDVIGRFQKYCDIMREGGVTAANITKLNRRPTEHLGSACIAISDWYNLIKAVDDATLILSSKDIRKAKENNKAGVIFGFQNTTPLETTQKVSNTYKCWGGFRTLCLRSYMLSIQ